MGSSTPRIVGGSSAPQPATPDSYGVPPAPWRLPTATRLGPVRLQVAELTRSLDLYERVLGMRALDRTGGLASLGGADGGRPLVELVERPGARPAGRRGRLGLYHFAILLPDRAALGRFARHLGETGVNAGAADHLVSEAFYLNDADGLGIEVYADRPRSSWRRIGRELMMTTDPLDVDALVAGTGDSRWNGMPAGTVIGHVHLHVGALEQAGAFYSDALGFDRMVWSYPEALFFGAGGYHHHVGTNTWAGRGAQAPAADDAQLLDWTLELPDAGAIAALATNVQQRGHAAERPSPDELLIADPWGTRVRVRAQANERA